MLIIVYFIYFLYISSGEASGGQRRSVPSTCLRRARGSPEEVLGTVHGRHAPDLCISAQSQQPLRPSTRHIVLMTPYDSYSSICDCHNWTICCCFLFYYYHFCYHHYHNRHHHHYVWTLWFSKAPLLFFVCIKDMLIIHEKNNKPYL